MYVYLNIFPNYDSNFKDIENFIIYNIYLNRYICKYIHLHRPKHRHRHIHKYTELSKLHIIYSDHFSIISSSYLYISNDI